MDLKFIFLIGLPNNSSLTFHLVRTSFHCYYKLKVDSLACHLYYVCSFNTISSEGLIINIFKTCFIVKAI